MRVTQKKMNYGNQKHARDTVERIPETYDMSSDAHATLN